MVKGFKGAKVQIDQFPPVGQPSYAVALGQAVSFIGKLSAGEEPPSSFAPPSSALPLPLISLKQNLFFSQGEYDASNYCQPSC